MDMEEQEVKEATLNPFLATKRRHKHPEDCSLEECSEEAPPVGKRARLGEVQVSRYGQEFQEVRVIGQGIHGTVFLVRHRLDGVQYAVKVSQEGRLATGAGRSRLQEEVWALAALGRRGRGVVAYYSSWVEGGRLYIQTEWCNGGSLEEQIAGRRRQGQEGVGEEQLLQVLDQVAGGLARMHEAGMAHLDVKPENILIHKERDDEIRR